MKAFIIWLYKFKNPLTKKIVSLYIYKIDGGETRSTALREIFRKYYGVDVGLYSMGGCFTPFGLGRKVTVGRYCSLARTVFCFTRNHPMDFKSMHAFFFNPAMRMVQNNRIEYIPLKIGNDVWIGEHALIMPNVREIGDGAVIAAGAVVNKDVPPYAVVVGNPARIVRYRFSPEVITKLLEEKWWEKDIDELKKSIEDFNKPFDEEKFLNS